MAGRDPQPTGMDPRTQLDTSIIGRTGLKAFAGRIYEEFDPNLSQEKWRRICLEMISNDPVVGAYLYMIEMLLRGTEWRYDPADESNAAQMVADRFQSMLYDMEVSWQDTLTDVLSMIPWGWAFMETNFKQRNGDSMDPTQHSQFSDGWVGWRSIAIRSQDSLLRWELDAEGDVVGMWQMAPPTYIPTLIPSVKALHFRTRPRKQNPEGYSVLRNAYRPWYFKKRIENLLGIGIERDLAGLPIAYVPAEIMAEGASQSDQMLLQRIMTMVTNIRRDDQEGVVMPLEYDQNGHPMYDLKLLSTGGTRQFDILGVVNYYDQRIAGTVLADFMLLGHEQVGSFALANSKTGTFSASLSATLDAVCEEINEHGVPNLMRLNGLPMELAPKLNHGDVQAVDLQEIGQYLQSLGMAGIPLAGDKDLTEYLFKIAHFPVPQDLQDAEAYTGIDMAPEMPANPTTALPKAPGQPPPGDKPVMPGVEGPFNGAPQQPPSGIPAVTNSSPGGATYVRQPPQNTGP